MWEELLGADLFLPGPHCPSPFLRIREEKAAMMGRWQGTWLSNLSWFALDFSGFCSESPTPWELLQSHMNWDGWSPSWGNRSESRAPRTSARGWRQAEHMAKQKTCCHRGDQKCFEVKMESSS